VALEQVTSKEQIQDLISWTVPFKIKTISLLFHDKKKKKNLYLINHNH
jgi:hypothetical protein